MSMMPSILRMNSIISPSLSALSPHLLKPNPKLAFLSLSLAASKSFFCTSPPLPFVRPDRRLCLPKPSLQARAVYIKGHRAPPSGEIHVIVGPMFAGKTSSLLRRIESESSNGRSVAVIKSDKDTRYGLDSIVTHDGAKFPCVALGDLSSFRQKFGAAAYDQLDVIGIDEAQFFEDLYDFCREAADRDGKMVVVAGLDGDYLRRSFGCVLDIIPLADTVTKLTARCEMCGERAFFTLRKSNEVQTELIGGADVYMPVCRRHYATGQAVIETTRSFLFLEESPQQSQSESHTVHCG